MRGARIIIFFAIAAGCFTAPIEALAEEQEPAAGESITYSAGVCLGMCPMFSVTVTLQGGMFHGGAFTAHKGDHAFPFTPEQYRSFAKLLAPFRPQGKRLLVEGSPDCEPAHTDDRDVDVAWGEQDHLTLYYGCENPALRTMKDELDKAAGLLPIAGFIGKR